MYCHYARNACSVWCRQVFQARAYPYFTLMCEREGGEDPYISNKTLRVEGTKQIPKHATHSLSPPWHCQTITSGEPLLWEKCQLHTAVCILCCLFSLQYTNNWGNPPLCFPPLCRLCQIYLHHLRPCPWGTTVTPPNYAWDGGLLSPLPPCRV